MILRQCVLLLLALLLVVPGRGVLAAEAPLRYTIQVDLDYPSGTATVQQRVAYVNRTGARLTSLAFNVTPIHFGAFTLTSAAVDGRPVQPAFQNVTMELPLPAPLAPGATAEVLLTYRLKVPAQANLRFGRAGGVLALGNWHPTVEMFKAGRWTRYRYTDVGDAFFTEAADYEVALAVAGAPAAGLKVAHSGELLAHEGNQWTFRGRQIRDFALAMSDRYQTRSQVVGGTTVTAFHLPERAAAGAQMLQTAVAALGWANEALGPYPYSSLQVAETGDPAGIGQEYPNLVFIGSGVLSGPVGPGSYLAYVVAHEVIHQWFYAVVGNDQVREPWLDEGLTTHLSYLFLRAAAPDAYKAMWANVIQTYRTGVATWGDPPLDSTIYDFQDDRQYFALLYRKGALFLDELRQLMGDRAYLAMLRDFVATHRYGIATTDDFLTLARTRAPEDVPPLVRRYFSPAAYRSAFGSPAPVPPTPSPSPAATAVGSPTASPSPTVVAVRSPAASSLTTPTPLPSPTATPIREPSATPTATPWPTDASPTPILPPPTATPVPITPAPEGSSDSPAAGPGVSPEAILTPAGPEASPSPPGTPLAPSTGRQEDSWVPVAVAMLAAGAGLGGLTAYAVWRRR